MNPTDVPNQVLQAITQHIPPNWEWLPDAGLIACMAVGIVFMVKGARLTPILAAAALGCFGVAGASVAAQRFGLPVWPSAAVGGGIGLALGVLLFRVWFALLVGASLAVAGLTLYGGQVMLPALGDYAARGMATGEDAPEITLPEVGQTAPAVAWQSELGEMWAHLGARVPSLEVSLLAIALAAGVAGLVFALLLPKAARACWAATTGVVLFMPATYSVFCNHWPPAAAILGRWGLLIAAILWSGSLLYNLADVIERRPKKTAVAKDEAATA